MPTRWRDMMFVTKVLSAIAVLSGGILFWMNGHYFNTCPKAPDIASGHIFPLDNRGTFVYLTLAEHNKITASIDVFGGAIACSICAELFRLIWKELRRTRA